MSEKLGKLPIDNCRSNSEGVVKNIAVFKEENGELLLGDTYCSVVQKCLEIDIELEKDGNTPRLICREQYCRERK